MKNILCLTVSALALLAFASTAQSKTAQANGTFDFDLQGATGAVVFDADSSDLGPVHGQMYFTATAVIGVEVCTLVDVEHPEIGCVSEPTGGTVPANVTLGVQFDCLVVQDNRAAMSGQVTSPTNSPFFGQQALLIVEDHVVGVSPDHDGFAWGAYAPTPKRVNTNPVTGQDF